MHTFTRLIKILTQLEPQNLALYALYKFGLKTGHYRRVTPIGGERISARDSFRALFSLPPRELILQILGEDGKRSLIEEADEIVRGKFRQFGGDAVELNLRGDWQPAHWTEFESGKIKLDGDVKFVWEAARFGWAFVLGRAYHITQDEIYTNAFWSHFEMFHESNPVNTGIHWMNGQEVGLRLIALTWALHVFDLSETRKAVILESIANHAARILPTLPYARSQNNNHLITESAALYTAGLLLNHTGWREVGWKWFNWCAQNQISGYGEYIQHSVNYHRVMLQTALWMRLIQQDTLPKSSAQAFSRAAHWLFSMLDNESGETPNLGSNDGALILPLSVAHFRDYRPTAQAGARAFLDINLKSGAWDEMSAWLNLPARERVVSSDEYLTENLHGKNSWAYLRASSFKSRLSHMDQLHLDLWRRGINIAQDAGTYLYNANAPWDNSLMETRVHNTVSAQGKNQMTRAGRFMALDWVSAYTKNIIQLDENVLSCMEGHYRVREYKHSRVVTTYRDERWLIRDEVTTYKTTLQTFRLHWLLCDGNWRIEESDGGVSIHVENLRGGFTLAVKSTLNVERFAFSLVRAGELLRGERDTQPYEGWVSRTYGHKVPALSFAVDVASARDVEFISEFIFG